MPPVPQQQALKLPEKTARGRARAAALRASTAYTPNHIAFVSYRSTGHLLLIGDEKQALALAKQLRDQVQCTVLVDTFNANENGISLSSTDGIRIARGRLGELRGYLGHFTVNLSTSQGEVNLAQRCHLGQTHFDLVLDLGLSPSLEQEILPPGYYAPRDNPQALAQALDEIPGLVGEFEKPKFFNYDSSICAHGQKGLQGCSRCLEACPTLAITSVGDKIQVNPYLCQGGGSCTAACPTGAITYAYPTVDELLSTARAMLKHYRQAGGTQARVLFYDRETGAETFTRLAPQIPEEVLPFEVEEIGSVGMDIWLTLLAYGASQVILLTTPATAPSVLTALEAQLSYAIAILKGMGYGPQHLQLLIHQDDPQTTETLQAFPSGPEIEPASFATFNEKRTTLRLAVEHLFQQTPAPQPIIPLPAGAPFGEIQVDRQTCTLCLACVSVCPASALLDGGEKPQLRFIEANCVQCGVCQAACPEDAIALSPRMVYESIRNRETRVLNEEEPFACIECGKPFATQKMIARMMEKLKGHWMFQDEKAIRRLQMCETCRVKDLYPK